MTPQVVFLNYLYGKCQIWSVMQHPHTMQGRLGHTHKKTQNKKMQYYPFVSSK